MYDLDLKENTLDGPPRPQFGFSKLERQTSHEKKNALTKLFRIFSAGFGNV